MASIAMLFFKNVLKMVIKGLTYDKSQHDRLATFFENMGWKVYTVPETATILLGGRVKFAELSHEQAYLFQKDLLKTMLQIEDWKTSRTFLLCKKGDVHDIGNYRPIYLLSVDSYANKQDFGEELIEVSREYKLPLRLTFIDLKKAFDSVEIEAVVEALLHSVRSYPIH
ncbi:unnamed protein product [Heligmosomoides polygyrus]|uniref:Reverse transcriptase domain-containing protein n=1 Tax=Heligmosomoides polygyrus TaxID=6339 RepID=A0A183GG73_HELPZ|nr:unnamed protein product [Heligmosomoides polygyrus]